jgi:Mg-chelatase subunit ChlD
MKKNLVELVFIVDRSGSMSSIASDMQGAIKSVINDQKKLDKDVLVTFIRFDTEYEKVFNHIPISEVKDITIEPRGSTALLDAIGKTINSFEREFSEMDEDGRPEKVLFSIITDGEENASHEFSRTKVFGMIETVKRDHSWDFVFIGANQDAIGEGSKIGISRDSSLNYKADSRGIACMASCLTDYSASYFSGGSAKFNEES